MNIQATNGVTSFSNYNSDYRNDISSSASMPKAPDLNNDVANLAETLLTAISGSSIALANDAVPTNQPSDLNTATENKQATSRYTGNTCDADGLVKSSAEGGLIAGAAGVTTGALSGALTGSPGGIVGAAGGAIAGAAIGVISGVVSGGTAHEVGCN